MKKHTKYILVTVALAVFLLSLTGCMEGIGASSQVVDTKTAILNTMAGVASVETAITLDMQAHIGSHGSSDAHSASIGSDITIQMTANPLAVHAEYYSRILVDGVATRDDKEYYIVHEDNDEMGKYLYVEETDEWEHTTLTVAEAMAVPAQTGLIYDWTSFLSYLEDENYTETIEGKTCNRLSGEAPANLLQEFFISDNVFGSFMYSTEMLLTDLIPCVLYVDSTTYQPVQIIFTFHDCFIVSDMIFDTAEVVVSYSQWNELPTIDIPKKVEIVAVNPNNDFYSTYYAWNLFLPYITNNEETGNIPGNNDVSFTADWSTFQVRIDGGMTQLPILPSDMEKKGYLLDSRYSSTIVEPNQYIEDVPLSKGADTLYCAFYNPDAVAQPISSCVIGAIDLYYVNIPNGGIQLYLPGEVALGISREALVSAYGDPDTLTTAFASDTYTWQGEGENQSFTAEVSTVSGAVIRLSLRNIPVTGGIQ